MKRTPNLLVNQQFDQLATDKIESARKTWTVGFLCLSLMLLPITCAYATVHTSSLTQTKYVKAILGEAEGEPFVGKLAVACAILNRPKGLQGVYGKDSNRHLYASNDMVQDSIRAWIHANNYPDVCWDLIQGADAWENVKAFGNPDSWGAVYYITTIGNHNFYRRIEGGK